MSWTDYCLQECFFAYRNVSSRFFTGCTRLYRARSGSQLELLCYIDMPLMYSITFYIIYPNHSYNLVVYSCCQKISSSSSALQVLLLFYSCCFALRPPTFQSPSQSKVSTIIIQYNSVFTREWLCQSRNDEHELDCCAVF